MHTTSQNHSCIWFYLLIDFNLLIHIAFFVHKAILIQLKWPEIFVQKYKENTKIKSNDEFFFKKGCSVIHSVKIFFWKAVEKVIRTDVCSTLLNWTWFSWNCFRHDSELVDILATFKNQRWDTIKSWTNFNFLATLLILFFNWLCNVHTSNVSTVIKSLFDPPYLFKVHRVLKEFFNFLVAL